MVPQVPGRLIPIASAPDLLALVTNGISMKCFSRSTDACTSYGVQ
jgi:hypothetical protein